jgi:hypothetical protein
MGFVRPGTVKYIHYLEVQLDYFFKSDSGEIRCKKCARNAVELIKLCEKEKPYFSYGQMELCLCVYS